MALADTPTVDDFWRLLQRLAGSSYGPEDEESVWQGTLRAWAVLLQLGRESIDRAFRQAYPGLSDDLIEEWETAFQLPNDAARTIAERQKRLADTEKNAKGGSRPALDGALGVASDTAQLTGNRADSVAMSGAPEAAVFQAALHFTNEEFYNPSVRQAAERICGRAINARNVGQLDDASAQASSVVRLGARHADPSFYFDRDGLLRQEFLPRLSPLQPSRVKSFGPGSKLRASDINRIQEGMLSSLMHGDGLDTDVNLYASAMPGMVTRWFAWSGANLDEVVIDDTMDWRERLVVMHSSHSDTFDIRPGGAADYSQGLAPLSDLHVVYTGPGSLPAGTTYRAVEATGGSTPRHAIYARDYDGALMARPEFIVGTRYAWGVVFASEDLNP